MNDIAIQVCNLSKQFQIGARRVPYHTLRETLSDAARLPLRWVQKMIAGNGNSRAKPDEFWALRNISFEVSRGEVVGIIGRNGAGKSTLLKILSRISDPTSGFAEMYGRTGSLLEVGTGFHPELTGRENIYLNGAILGMTKSEINAKFDEIIAFSEVADFVDTPVKHYSSGMHLRLAFAVAAQLESEILLMDEVLAVGDAAFQRKCLGKMGSVAQQGRTVLFVSHNMAAVRDLCSRAIWIEKGRIAADADVNSVVKQYLDAMADGEFQFVNRELEFSIERVVLKNSAGDIVRQFSPGEDLTVEIAYHAQKVIRGPYVQIVIESANGKCFTASMLLDGARPEVLSGYGTIGCTFRAVPLLPQSYAVKTGIRAQDGRGSILPLQDVAAFDIDAAPESIGLNGAFRGLAYRSTPVLIPYEWKLPDGTVVPVALRTPEEKQPAYAGHYAN
ncbi:MAG: ABC transporter ATP-binding protein [Acidobacteriaceae bacterium]|nr:ABC transporter ATP-binding protein [Acidobacteriaceae bacterium]